MTCCCGDDDDQKNVPIRYEENRSCTDCLCLLLFVAFWGGFIAVAAVAFDKGRPERLIYGTDYLGFRCGGSDVPQDYSSTYVTADTQWQSATWSENKLLWFPVPYTTESFSLDVIINSGVCVKTCPFLTQAALNEITTHGADIDAYTASIKSYLTVKTYGAQTIDNMTTFAPAEQYVMYSTEEFFHRCIPAGLSPGAINETLSKIPEFTEVTSFFYRGFAECGAAWRVFLITLFITFFIAFVYIFIMRFIIKPMVYLAIFLGFALLVLAGAAAYNRYKALNDMANDTSNQDNYVNFYLAAAIISWACALLYLILLIFMRKRISLACAIVTISGRVLASGPTLLLVPPCIGIFLLGICAWALGVGVYLYSAQDFEYRPELIPVFNASSNSFYGSNSSAYVQEGAQLFANATVKMNDISFSRRDLVFYDLFGFLWTMGFINAIGYMVISFVTIFWYYSDLDDSNKAVPVGAVCKAIWWTLRYHLGTLAFGSLIIAIIQFIRILMNYFYKKSKMVKENQAAKLVMCCANCIMACFERIVNVISKNAYILTAITNKSFCCAAKDAFNLVVDNALTMFLLNLIVGFVMIIGKLVIVAGSVLIAYCLMKYGDLAPGVETYIFPLILIGFGAYFIAALFFSVYSVAVDANFVCYNQDRKTNAGTGLYYVPKELEDQISNYNKAAKLEEMAQHQDAAHNQAK